MYFGEINGNRLEGKGIKIFNDSRIDIGYFNDGAISGNYIRIYLDGLFSVGEFYRDAND